MGQLEESRIVQTEGGQNVTPGGWMDSIRRQLEASLSKLQGHGKQRDIVGDLENLRQAERRMLRHNSASAALPTAFLSHKPDADGLRGLSPKLSGGSGSLTLSGSWCP